MSSEIDLSHVVSGGGGAVAYGIVDRVIRFFIEAKKRESEVAMASKLATIEEKLDQTLRQLAASAGLAERLARLEGLEEGRKQAQGAHT